MIALSVAEIAAITGGTVTDAATEPDPARSSSPGRS